MAELHKVPTGKFHPGYGCAIFAIMILTFGGIVTWMIYSGIAQDRQIATFTVENASPLPQLDVGDEDKLLLRKKLISFADNVDKGDEKTELSLEVKDCNALLALATEAGIGGKNGSQVYPDIIRIKRFDAVSAALETDLRYPIQKLTLVNIINSFTGQPPKEIRLLVGSATFKPDFDNGSFVVKIDAITVPGKPVSKGFVQNLQIAGWGDMLSLAKSENARIADTLKKITAWHITEDGSHLVLECSKAAPASTATPSH